MSKQKLSPINLNESKNDSCLFCSYPADSIRTGRTSGSDSIILDDGDEAAKVLKALCNHLMPQNQDDIPEKFSPEMFPFCISCKNLVTALWECQEVIRKTQLRMAEITTVMEKKVINGVILDLQLPSSAATSSEKRFLKLRHVIFENYRETLLLMKNEKLLSVPLVPTTLDHVPAVAVVQIVNTSTLHCLPVTKDCDADADEVASNCADAEMIFPEVPPSPKDASGSRSQGMDDPNFEEEHHVHKAEMSSESEMGGESDDDDFENIQSTGEDGDKIKTSPSPSPPPLFGPFPRSRKRVKRRTERMADFSVTKQRKGSRPKSNVETHLTQNKKIMKGHRCDVCNKILGSARGLRRHQYEIHGAGRNERFSCPNCSSQFTRQWDLNRHSRQYCKGRL